MIFSFGMYLKLYWALAYISRSFSPPSLLSTPDLVVPALNDFFAITTSLLSDILQACGNVVCPLSQGN